MPDEGPAAIDVTDLREPLIGLQGALGNPYDSTF
jgi:hypothetical protein